jgi:hypothetical protein
LDRKLVPGGRPSDSDDWRITLMSGGMPLISATAPLTRFPSPPWDALSYNEVAMRRIAAFFVIAAIAAADGGNSWNKIRYSGGTVEAKVNPFDWNTTLTITGDAVTLQIGPRQTLRLKPTQVTALSYGQEAHRRVADMVALSVVATPLALFGILHKSKAHFVGIEYKTEDGKPGAVLLEADKNNYRDILKVLAAVTGKPVQNAP